MVKEKEKKIKILGIETSCDETSVAVVENGRNVLSNVVSSQVEIHARFGGVVPEVASRNHVQSIDSITKKALNDASLTIDDIDAIAVTYGAGLIGALMVGVNFAKALAYANNKPLIAVNHIKGHIASNYIAFKELKPPFVCLIVSGGHTALLDVSSYYSQTKISTTLDDAVGEAYDKVARVVGLGYPGGPKIDKAAKTGNPDKIVFSQSKKMEKKLDFSYSGLKTAVINYVHKLKQRNADTLPINDIAASFQKHAIEPLVEKSIIAAKRYNRNKIVVAGGVAANSYLRERLSNETEKNKIKAYFPPLSLCTDNAAMIAAEGYFKFLNSEFYNGLDLTPKSNIPLDLK